jgi:hypothetical protein
MLQKIPIDKINSIHTAVKDALSDYFRNFTARYVQSFISFIEEPAPNGYLAKYNVLIYLVQTDCPSVWLMPLLQKDNNVFQPFAICRSASVYVPPLLTADLYVLLKNLLELIKDNPDRPLSLYAVRFIRDTTASRILLTPIEDVICGNGRQPSDRNVFSCRPASMIGQEESAPEALFIGTPDVGYYLCEGKGANRVISYVFMPELGLVNGVYCYDFICGDVFERQGAPFALPVTFSRKVRIDKR